MIEFASSIKSEFCGFVNDERGVVLLGVRVLSAQELLSTLSSSVQGVAVLELFIDFVLMDSS